MNDNNKPARKYSSPLIKKILSEITPLQKARTHTKMTLAARLDDLLIARGWGKSEFAKKVDKNPSEISKWLSGTHNFTIDTLAEIAVVLNMSVEELFAPEPPQVINKMQVIVPVKDVEQSVRYITPVTAVADNRSNYYTGNYRGGMYPSTARIQK
jgi:transcriptional regulator with XRE-family HTH domain